MSSYIGIIIRNPQTLKVDRTFFATEASFKDNGISFTAGGSRYFFPQKYLPYIDLIPTTGDDDPRWVDILNLIGRE